MIEKSFCTTREAAALLGVSVGTVQLWVESGLLQAWKTAGGHRRVLRDSVEGLLRKKPAVAPAPAEAVVTAPPVGERRLHIMVVDDDPILLRLYEVNMARWPMAPEVSVVNTAVAALLHIGRTAPDLMVMDLEMPGMDGFRMLRELRASPAISKTTIVVVTGLDSAEIEARGGIPTGIEVLPKPIPFARLLAVATDLVSQNRFQLPAH